jgi:hypothetical protein
MVRDVKFITSGGLKSAKKASKREIDGFLETIYFKEEVLKKYESNKDFQIGDDGTVLFGYDWGLFRGVYRVAKGYLAVNLGDLGEGFPAKELEHWKQYNVDPKTIKRADSYFDFRNNLKRMIYFMNQSNRRINHYCKLFFPEISQSNSGIFILHGAVDVLVHIKKIINEKTTLDEFQSRIIFLNILLIESVNVKLIGEVFNQIGGDLNLSYNSVCLKECYLNYLKDDTPKEMKTCFKGTIVPLKSLELLRKFLLFMRIYNDLIIVANIRSKKQLLLKRNNLKLEVNKSFHAFYRSKFFNENFTNRDYFEYWEKTINANTGFLKLLNTFRNSSSAHGFNSENYKKILKKLNISETEEDYSKIYEVLISHVSYDIEHIYFNLILPDPPLIEVYTAYANDALSKLKSSSGKYRPVFEDLFSYLQEFPTLYRQIILEVKKIYILKRDNSEFILEFGHFIELLSMNFNYETQKLVDYIILGLEFEKALSIVRFAHIISNSKKVSAGFLKRILPIIYAGVKDKTTLNTRTMSIFVISCIIEKYPERLNKRILKKLFEGENLVYKNIEKFLS